MEKKETTAIEQQPPRSAASLTRARLPALDGVRGLAIALVMVYHFIFMSGAWNSASSGDRFLWKFAGAGWSGVDLFFVLSGFLITGILYDARSAARGYFQPFYARRVLRIFPLYYLFLLLLVVGLPIVHPDADVAVDEIRRGMGWYATFTTNIWTVFDSGLHQRNVFAGHLWSLAVEEQFYLIWPLVVFLLNRRLLMAVCVGAIIGAFWVRLGLVAAGSGMSIPYVLAPARMDTLAIGALIALAARDSNDLRLLAYWLRPLALVSVAGIVAIAAARGDISPPFDGWVVTVGFSLVACAFGGLLLAAITFDRASAVLSHPLLRWLGKYSYALYLFHLPIATIIIQRTNMVERFPDMFGTSWPGIFTYCLVCTACSLVAGWLSWHAWEQQFLKLKDRFPYRSARPVRLSE